MLCLTTTLWAWSFICIKQKKACDEADHNGHFLALQNQDLGRLEGKYRR